MNAETLNYLLAQISTGFKRRFNKDLSSLEPRLRVLHERLEALAPADLRLQAVADTRFVVIDTETTGFRAYGGDEIVSVALLEMRGTRLTGREYQTLVDPGRPIPAESSEIHGIRDRDVAGMPHLMEVLPDVVEFIGESVIIGHHVNFDLRFLNKVLQTELLTRLRHPWLDTMLLYTAWSGRVGHYSLEEVAQSCAVDLADRHTARGDALITARVFTHLAGGLVRPGDALAAIEKVQYTVGYL